MAKTNANLNLTQVPFESSTWSTTPPGSVGNTPKGARLPAMPAAKVATFRALVKALSAPSASKKFLP